MEKEIYIAPSTDPIKKDEEIIQYARLMQDGGADFLHCDIMDGEFVKNKTYGSDLVDRINQNTLIPLDVHLMVAQPEKCIEAYCEAGANILTVHFESFNSETKLKNVLKDIRKKKMLAGLSIKPRTKIWQIENLLPFCDLVLIMSVEPGESGQQFIKSSLQKVEKLKKIKDKEKLNLLIEVDGGINPPIAKKLKESGVDIIVSGSYIFDQEDKAKAINSLK